MATAAHLQHTRDQASEHIAGSLVLAGLRPTLARITMLRVFHAEPQRRLTQMEVALELQLCEATVKPGSISKCLRDLVEHGLLTRSQADTGLSQFELPRNPRKTKPS